MSTIRDALRARIDGDIRATIKVKIYGDPEAKARLLTLENEAAQLRADAALGGRAKKMNSRLDDVMLLIEETEQRLLDVTYFIVLRALTSDQLAEASSGVIPDDPISKLWRAQLARAFVRVEDLDGKPVDDVTAQDWAELLDTMSAREVQTRYDELQAADAAVANPS